MNNDERSKYPEANGCNDQDSHILGPWSPLMEAFDNEGNELSIQVSQCLRCGHVTSQAFRMPKHALEEGLRRGRFLAVLEEQKWGLPNGENHADPDGSQHPCGDEPSELG